MISPASNWVRTRQSLSEFASSTVALLAAIVLALLILSAICAPIIAAQNPYDLAQLNVLEAKLPPGSISNETGKTFFLGSDEQGRDMLSAILYGLRVSIGVGLAATLVALTIGTVVGLVAGYYGGRIESFLMRIVDLQLSFPAIMIALVLVSILGQGIGKVIIALVAVQWAYYARTARSAAIVERNKEYIEAAKGLRLSPLAILTKHLLPNCLPPLLVVGALQIASAISLEATLSFLGVGLPVTEPSLGLLISNGFAHMLSGKYWMSVFPGVALLIVIVAINLVGDQLRDVLNPRLKAT